MARPANKISYDKFWGVLLAAGCILPARLDSRSYLWQLLDTTRHFWTAVWLLGSAAAALLALVAGFAGWRSRWRHFLNFSFGVVLLVLPLVSPEIWLRFPHVHPARLQVGELASIGWVVLLALAAIYAGSGIRVARPSQIAGQALAALGAFLLAVFVFLPAEGVPGSYGAAKFAEMAQFRERWRDLTPLLLVALGALLATLNLVRSRAEVFIAHCTRLLMVGGLFFWIALPFLEDFQAGSGRLARHVPVAWGAIHFMAPLFLSLDGCIAFIAISITRSSE